MCLWVYWELHLIIWIIVIGRGAPDYRSKALVNDRPIRTRSFHSSVCLRSAGPGQDNYVEGELIVLPGSDRESNLKYMNERPVMS